MIDLSARNTTPKDIDQNLEKFIRENEKGKYVFSLEYDGKIPYAQYIETIDIVFNVVYRFRDEMAIRKFQVPYAQLERICKKKSEKPIQWCSLRHGQEDVKILDKVSSKQEYGSIPFFIMFVFNI